MVIHWDSYPVEKLAVKLKYLDLKKDRFSGERFNVRKTLNAWFFKEFPHMKTPGNEPMETIGGTFDHKEGLFYREHRVRVTDKALIEDAKKNNVSVPRWIDILTAKIRE